VTSWVFFRSYLRAVHTTLSLLLIPIVDRIVQWRGGYAFEEMAPGRFAQGIEIPTFYIQAKEDPWTELSDIQGFYEGTPEAEELWIIEAKRGRFEAYNYVDEHAERILACVEKHFSHQTTQVQEARR
jgi:hypothetical protein